MLTTSELPVTREESASPAYRACLPCDRGSSSCRSALQIRSAEKVGEARVRAKRVKHGVRFYESDAYYGAIFISLFQPFESLLLLPKARIDFGHKYGSNIFLLR